MASLYDMVAAFHALGLELKATGEEAEQAATKIRDKNAAAQDTSAGIADDPTSTVERVEATSLGDAGNPEAQMMKLYQAIEAAKRGR